MKEGRGCQDSLAANPVTIALHCFDELFGSSFGIEGLVVIDGLEIGLEGLSVLVCGINSAYGLLRRKDAGGHAGLAIVMEAGHRDEVSSFSHRILVREYVHIVLVSFTKHVMYIF